MAVLAAAKHRTVKTRAAGSTSARGIARMGADVVAIRLADKDMGMVDVAKEELGIVEDAWRKGLPHIGCRFATAAAEHVARRQVVFHAIDGANDTIINIHIGMSRIGEDGAKWRVFRRPSFAIALRREVARAAGIVALAHRGAVAAAIHVAHHSATVHGDVSIAIHLACCDAGDFCIVKLACLFIFQFGDVSIRAFATAIDVVSDEAIFEEDARVFVHMAVFATAIQGSRDAGPTAEDRITDFPIAEFFIEVILISDVTRIIRFVVFSSCIAFDIDVNHGIIGIGAVGHHITIASKTLAAAKHIAVVFTGFLEFTSIAWKDILNRIQLVRIIFSIIDGFTILIPRTHIVVA